MIDDKIVYYGSYVTGIKFSNDFIDASNNKGPNIPSETIHTGCLTDLKYIDLIYYHGEQVRHDSLSLFSAIKVEKLLNLIVRRDFHINPDDFDEANITIPIKYETPAILVRKF